MKKENKSSFDKNYNPHGYWEIYYFTGELYYKGYYIHGQKHGLWEGDLSFVGYYHMGLKLYQASNNKILL